MLKFIQIIQDIVYASLGVQNSETSKKQFEQASLVTYFVAGLIGIALFVALILLIMSIVA